MQRWLDGVRVLELAGSLDAAVCGRALADAGAEVTVVRIELGEPPDEEPLTRAVLDLPKRVVPLESGEANRAEAVARLAAEADAIVVGGHPEGIARQGVTPERLAQLNARAAIVAITPFGLHGPRARWRASDLVTFHSSGLARILLGPVEDAEAEPPVRAAGEQSSFIAGLTGALATMCALAGRRSSGAGARIDVSAEEALASVAARELAMPAFGGVPSRTRTPGQIGLTYVVPASDGYVAISPRETHQWRAWLEVMGNPLWADEPEMQERAERMQHGDRLIAHIAPWSSLRTRRELFELAQAAHVPCFPVNEPSDVLGEPQFESRGSLETVDLPGVGAVRAPRAPFRVTVGAEGERRESRREHHGLPLEGVRVVDFSWVIAGPTCTRFLAAMGAEVIKVESPARPDPGRGSALHDVLGQSKRSLAMDLKAPGAIDAVRRVIAKSDVVVENFAAGVMERLGLDYESLRRLRPDLVMLSATGVGRTGPLAETVAYGTLLQAFTGMTALNGQPGRPPTTGFAWADPLSALMMASAVVAALHGRERTGAGCHIDFSMAEALLWTLPGVLVRRQLAGGEGGAAGGRGNASARFAPHGLYRAAGTDDWVAIAVTDDETWRALCAVVGELAPLQGLDESERRERTAEVDAAVAAWARGRLGADAAEELQRAGVPAAASANTQHLFEDAHLEARGFYSLVSSGEQVLRLPGLPWRWDGAAPRLKAAPELGAQSIEVLREVAGLDAAEVEALRQAGALGAR